MKPASFAYYRPRRLGEMLDLLQEHGEDGKILAGGQSLVPAMNFRLARPAHLFDLNDLAELDFLRLGDGVLSIGALTRHAAFHNPAGETPLARLLSEIVHHIAHEPIRNRGTFCGSLAHADPASEWCLVAATLDAEIVARSTSGERAIPASAFFHGPFTTDLAAEEIITEVRLPIRNGNWRGGFYEFARRAGDFALAMALAAVRLENGTIAEARLGVGGVAGQPVRLEALEKQMIGAEPGARLGAEIGAAASAAIEPTDDIHASTEYRKDLIATVVKRALVRAFP
ncbi:MAG: FAD binding domain-containing protein [Acetobacteraceae bacterium]